MRQWRLRQVGHVHCMGDGRLPKDILYSEFYKAPHRTARTKLHYKDVIKRYKASFHIPPHPGKHFLPIATDGVPALWVTAIHCQPQSTQQKWRSTELIVVNDGMGYSSFRLDDKYVLPCIGRNDLNWMLHMQTAWSVSPLRRSLQCLKHL